ncbi:MAG TPA: phosphatase PAP2 family protein, partial [Planctomycetota bacterium]|nr:phosphatase PAP2 family protein [Planctomycetota bacterium]
MTFRTLRKDALALLFAAAACVALGAVFWFAKAADFAVVRLLNPSRSSFVDEVLHWLDRQGPRVLLATAGLALLAVLGWRRLAARRPAAAAWLLGMAWAQAVVNLGKTVVRRLRPLEGELGEALRRIRDVPDVARSLPSGHVTTATAVAAGLWLVLGPGVGKRRHLLALVPPLMMWDRMALGLHHPSDALFGAGAGLLCMAAAAFAVSFYVRGAPGAAAAATA